MITRYLFATTRPHKAKCLVCYVLWSFWQLLFSWEPKCITKTWCQPQRQSSAIWKWPKAPASSEIHWKSTKSKCRFTICKQIFQKSQKHLSLQVLMPPNESKFPENSKSTSLIGFTPQNKRKFSKLIICLEAPSKSPPKWVNLQQNVSTMLISCTQRWWESQNGHSPRNSLKTKEELQDRFIDRRYQEHISFHTPFRSCKLSIPHKLRDIDIAVIACQFEQLQDKSKLIPNKFTIVTCKPHALIATCTQKPKAQCNVTHHYQKLVQQPSIASFKSSQLQPAINKDWCRNSQRDPLPGLCQKLHSPSKANSR